MSLKVTRYRKRKGEMERQQREGDGVRRKTEMRERSPARFVICQFDVFASSRLPD